MKADKLTIEKIFDKTERLEAPLFQRPYVWNKERNWVPLWEAIEPIATRRLEGKSVRPHFLGTIVLDQMKTGTGQISVRQIIDGQQRLTTLQLLLAAIRDLCTACSEERYAEAFNKLTNNYVPLSDDEDDKLKVLPTNADRNDFKSVMWANSLEAVKAMPHSDPDDEFLIPDAYLYFYNAFRDWVYNDETNVSNKIAKLYTTLREDLNLVVIDLDEADDAQEIFETLNALGTPLLPADLVKNYLFREAEFHKLDSKKLYKAYWSPFDEYKSYWRDEVRQGRLKRPRLDHFLGHYLVCMQGEEVIATQLFSTFKDFVEKSSISADRSMESFKTYADIYKSFDYFNEDERIGQFFWRLCQMDVTTIYPLLLEAFNTLGKSRDEELLGVLMDIESFLVRRTICRLTTKSYNRVFADLMKVLRRTEFSHTNIRKYLLDQTAEASLWPDDERFKDAWLTLQFYKRLTKSFIRMVLEAIEQKMKTKKTEKVQLEHKLTVEHLLPVSWSEHWPLDVDESDPIEMEIARRHRDEVLQRIGNLTLLTNSLNPSLSNGPWHKKREQILKFSAFNINRELSEKWNEDTIEARSKELFQYALKIWPYPSY